MATQYIKHVSTLKTNQKEPATLTQVQNNAGGFVFELDLWAKLDRWLILGAEGGTYYASEQKLTKENATTILECLKVDGPRTVARIAEISLSGRAPKNDPAIFALAMASGDTSEVTRKAALLALPKVCRIGTHLFHFVRDAEQFRRWGRGMRTAIGKWYTTKMPDKLGYDVVKYQQRDGWSHRDILRLSHVHPTNPENGIIFRYITNGLAGFGPRNVKRVKQDKSETVMPYDYVSLGYLPPIIDGFEQAKTVASPAAVAQLIEKFGLTREMVPTIMLNHGIVWEALLQKMPMTALIRNLGKMTSMNLFKPMSSQMKHVVALLNNAEEIRKARLHPLTILMALMTYKQGHGEKGSLTWQPEREILDALDNAFYMAFNAIEPSGKNTLLAIDVSGSMEWGSIAGCPGVSPRVAAAAMAMVTMRTEKNWHAVAFSSADTGEWVNESDRPMQHASLRTGITKLTISPHQRLSDVVFAMQQVPMGGTDCALPMLYAEAQKLEVDTFIVLTDNETWIGDIHPFQALKQYRRSSGRAAKLVVVGMMSTGFSIADPSDAGMLDVVGMDSAAPSIIADFSRGS